MKYNKLLSIGAWISLLTMLGSFSLCGAVEAHTLNNDALVSKLPNVSFRNDIQPIFDANCVACHMEGAAPEGLILESGTVYQALVGQTSRQSRLQRISPTKPDESYLIQKLKGTHLNKLDSRLIDTLRAWIIQGAQDN